MTKSFYEQLNDVLKDIKKEGKIEDIKIEEVEDLYEDEEEYEEEVVDTNIPTKRQMKGTKLKKGLVAAMLALSITGMSVSNIPTVVTNGTAVTVEAASKKKDKKKPKITFKGKTKITAYKNKSIKIPKTTAKDNKDGNVTKKIKVTVKKGKKSYKSIAKKIKNNKKVKFTSTGKYTITYTVTDKAGNKATKKRYVTVKNKQKTATTTEATTQEKTTEQPTTEKPTTEQTTTETPTVETPTTDPSLLVDYSDYKINKAVINGKTYNTTRDPLFSIKVTEAPYSSDKLTINIKDDYDRLYFDVNSGLITNSQYAKFLGNITATDENGNDISDNIVIVECSFSSSIENLTIYQIGIYLEDINGNTLRKDFYLYLRSYDEDNTYVPESYNDPNLILINESPIVYARKRSNVNNLSTSYTETAKSLKFTKNINE